MDSELKEYMDNFCDKLSKRFDSLQSEVGELRELVVSRKSSIPPTVQVNKKEITKKEYEDQVIKNLNDDVLYEILKKTCEVYYKVRKEVLIVALCASSKQQHISDIEYSTNSLLKMKSGSHQSKNLDIKVALNNNYSIPQEKINETIKVIRGMLCRRTKRKANEVVIRDAVNDQYRSEFLEFITQAWGELAFTYLGKVFFILF